MCVSVCAFSGFNFALSPLALVPLCRCTWKWRREKLHQQNLKLNSAWKSAVGVWVCACVFYACVRLRARVWVSAWESSAVAAQRVCFCFRVKKNKKKYFEIVNWNWNRNWKSVLKLKIKNWNLWEKRELFVCQKCLTCLATLYSSSLFVKLLQKVNGKRGKRRRSALSVLCKQWLISATAATTTTTKHTTTSAVNARRFLELRRHSVSVRKHLVVAMFALTFTP